jgi:hypothetical protein
MPLIMPYAAANKIATAADPKRAIQEAVGDLSDIHLTKDDVLLGTYFRPEKTAGGIIRPDTDVSEDAWQGKVGLILKIGPLGFVSTPDYEFVWDEHGPFKVGDWVVYKIGDTWPLSIRGFPCRVVRDVNARIRTKDPNIIF